jgi:hypothetical protein
VTESDKTFLANIDTEFYNNMDSIDELIKYAWKQIDERIAEVRELEVGRKRLLESWPDE